jgi:hypothetical protein
VGDIRASEGKRACTVEAALTWPDIPGRLCLVREGPKTKPAARRLGDLTEARGRYRPTFRASQKPFPRWYSHEVPVLALPAVGTALLGPVLGKFAWSDTSRRS